MPPFFGFPGRSIPSALLEPVISTLTDPSQRRFPGPAVTIEVHADGPHQTKLTGTRTLREDRLLRQQIGSPHVESSGAAPTEGDILLLQNARELRGFSD